MATEEIQRVSEPDRASRERDPCCWVLAGRRSRGASPDWCVSVAAADRPQTRNGRPGWQLGFYLAPGGLFTPSNGRLGA